MSTNRNQRLLPLFSALAVLQLFFYGTFSVLAQDSPPANTVGLPLLTEARAVRAVAPQEAQRGFPVQLRGVVTFIDPDSKTIFLKDSSGSVSIATRGATSVERGNIVEVEGVTAPGRLLPMVTEATLKIIGRAAMPKPEAPSLKQIINGNADSEWILLQGVIRSISNQTDRVSFDLVRDWRHIKCELFGLPKNAVSPVVTDSLVTVHAICQPQLNELGKFSGVRLLIPSMADMTVDETAPANPFAMDALPTRELAAYSVPKLFQRRVKVEGVVTYQRLGHAFYLQDDTGGAYIQSHQMTALNPGDRVEVSGFPELLEYSPVLRDSIFRKIGSSPLPVPVPVIMEQPLRGDYNYKLVEVEGWLTESSTQNGLKVLVLQSGPQVFEARIEENAVGKQLDGLAKGARLKVTGTFYMRTDPQHKPVTFRIFLRSADDVTVMEKPSWWNFEHTVRVICLAVFFLAGAVAWAVLLRQRVRRQTLLMRRQLRRELALAELGHKLARADSAQAAARIIFAAAQDLLGWDACHLHLYAPEQNRIFPVLTMDTVNGERVEVEVEVSSENQQPSPTAREVMDRGAKLILRKSDGSDHGLEQYGDKKHKSASLMFVPLRDGTRVIGVLSIQSYTRNFYDDNKLSTLQALADHCGGALERIRTRDELQDAHDELERRVNERTAALTRANTQLQQEIIERKRVQEALAHSKHLFDSLLHNVPDFIYFKDAQCRFTRVNESFLNQTGLSTEQVIGKTDFDLFDKNIAQQAFNDEQRVMQTGQPLLSKEEHVQGIRDGEWWVITTKMPLRDEFGKIVGTFGVSRNITERKRAEMELAKKEEERRIIFDSVPAMIIYKDTQNRHLRSNKFTVELSGYSLEQIEGHSISDLNPKYGGKYFQDDLEVIRSGKPKLGIIEPLICANGEERWVQTDKIPYRDADGNVIGVIVFAIDITQRKAAEDALKASHDELERRVDERTAKLSKAIALLKQEINERRQAEVRNEAFSHLGQRLSQSTTPKEAARVVLDVAEKLLGWDAAYLHLFTKSEPRKVIPIVMFDTVNGQRINVQDNPRGDNLSARDQRTIESGAELLLGAEEPSKILSRFGDAGRPSLSRMFVPINNGLNVIGVLSIQSYTAEAYDQEDLQMLQALSDFCAGTLERIQAEQSSRESEERFFKAFRSSPVPMTLSMLHDGLYIDVNDSMVQLIGYSREEMIGHTSLELGIWMRTEMRAKLIEQIQEKRSVRDFECQLRTKFGLLRDVLLSVEQLDSGGKAYLLVNIHDVTERLNLEMQLRHSQKMEAIGQLAAGVAHDFNNLLTIIQGHIALLIAEKSVDENGADSLNQVSIASERAAALTRQLLAFSRKQLMQARQIDLNDVVNNTVHMLRPLVGENIVLSLSLTPCLPPLNADSGMIEQAIVNLAVNARDAMPQGGQLTLGTSVADVNLDYVRKNRESRPGHFVCLTVSDTGCGMDEQTLAHIFEPFFTTKEIGKGTGLGLATVYGIVKQHQGWLEVMTELGKGTTFKVFLPSSGKPNATILEPVLDEQIVGGDETILVVEDEMALRELVCNLLNHFGYRVMQAAHGHEAFKIWQEHRGEIDLLLTDMMMPEGLSGWELAEEIHKRQPDLKVIYTSGYSVDLFGQNRALREGVNFLAKPYHPGTLAKAVRDCLDA